MQPEQRQARNCATALFAMLDATSREKGVPPRGPDRHRAGRHDVLAVVSTSGVKDVAQPAFPRRD